MGSIIMSATVVLIGVALGLLRGGRLDALAMVRPRWWALLAGGFALQAVVERFDLPAAASLSVVAMFVLIVGLGANTAIRGTMVTAVGIAMNLLVLVLNGAVPVRFEALTEAGVIDAEVTRSQVSSVGHLLELETSATRLGWLGDTIPFGIFGSIISIGDMVTFAGVIVMVSGIIAARRRVGIDIDALFVHSVPDEMVAIEPRPSNEPLIDVAGDTPILDVSEGERAPLEATMDLTAGGHDVWADDLWADDDTGVRILGPSSKSS